MLAATGETPTSGSTRVSGSDPGITGTSCRPIWPTCRTDGGPGTRATAGDPDREAATKPTADTSPTVLTNLHLRRRCPPTRPVHPISSTIDTSTKECTPRSLNPIYLVAPPLPQVPQLINGARLGRLL